MFKKLKEKIVSQSQLNINIGSNFIFQGFSIILSFLIVPITINYLNKDLYGIWLLILSITNWIYTFDIGIGNGLKNKIAYYDSLNKNSEIKQYIASSYFFVLIVSILIFSLSVLSLYFMDLNNILNTKLLSKYELWKLLSMNIGFVCVNFILSLCNSIFIGSHKSYLAAINKVLGQLLFLLFLLILHLFQMKSIFYVSIASGSGVIFSNVILTGYYYLKYSYLKPKISDIYLKKIVSTFEIGGKIFISQIAGLIIFSSDNLIITYFLGPGKVAEYSIVNKFFSIPIIVLGLVLGPIWPLATKAYSEKNLKWFFKSVKKLKKLFLFVIFVNIGMILISNKFIDIWTLGEIKPSIWLILVSSLAGILTAFSSIYATLLNGINEINFMMFLAMFQAILNIILSVFFIKYLNLGSVGVILATCICMCTNVVTLPTVLKRKLLKISM